MPTPRRTTAPRAHHVGVTVSDLDRAVEFYTTTFDLDVAAEFFVAGEAFSDAVSVAGASASFAHLAAGDVIVELVEYEPQAEPNAPPELNQPGAIHLGLSVDDVEAFYNNLASAVETLSPPQTTATGTTICFLRDPDGNLIEVVDA